MTREPGGAFWLGGEFAQASGQARKNLAVVDPGTGALLPHDLHPNHNVAALAFSGGHVFVGGSFTGAGGPARENLAAIDLQTGAPTAFDPRPDDEVVTLAVGHGRLYAGGQFQAVGGVARPYLAAFDLPSQTLNAWAPEPDDEVNAIATDAGAVYVGGYFAKLGGVDQEGLAALDPATAASRPGFPQADDVVRGLAVADGRLFVGGEFDGTDSFGGEDRDYLAAVDLATGQVAAWAPTPDAIVFSIAAGGGRVFAGGTFDEVDGAPRIGVAGFDAASGAVLDWDAGLDTNDEVHGLALDGETVGLARRDRRGQRRRRARLGRARPGDRRRDARVGAAGGEHGVRHRARRRRRVRRRRLLRRRPDPPERPRHLHAAPGQPRAARGDRLAGARVRPRPVGGQPRPHDDVRGRRTPTGWSAG